jgi:hypothetical protein
MPHKKIATDSVSRFTGIVTLRNIGLYVCKIFIWQGAWLYRFAAARLCARDVRRSKRHRPPEYLEMPVNCPIRDKLRLSAVNFTE